MKKFSKILSVALLVALVLSLGVANAFAEDPAPADEADEGTTEFATAQAVGAATATITAPAGNHVYEIYQIFAGDLAEKNGKEVLSNVIWGTNSKGRGTDVNVGDEVAQSVLDELAATTGNDAQKLAVITKYVDISGTPVGEVTNSGSVTVPTGYYLIKDKDGSVAENEAYTQYIVEIVGNTSITRKADQPTSYKEVKDINDSTETAMTDWQETADYDVNDVIPYKLTAVIPATVNLDDFSEYKLVFTDTISKGLTYNASSVSIKVNGTEVAKNEPTSAAYAGDEAAYAGGNVLTWDLGNIKAAPYNVTTAGTAYTITIEYTATLNSNAVVGAAGNPNKMHIEFSRNPNNTDDKGKTPDDTNIVFTYKVVVNKVDGEEKPLAGATFTLYKEVANTTTTGAQTGATIKAGFGSTIKADGLIDSKYYVEVGTVEAAEVKNGDTVVSYTANFEKVDDGNYVLVETVIPAGFNAWESKTFTIEATHTQDPGELKLSDLNATGELTMAGDTATGSMSTSIKNNSGTTLPSTGGIGTTIFYVVGGVLVLAAIILLVTKKRMSE